jgi:RNA-directed DNA polymerase
MKFEKINWRSAYSWLKIEQEKLIEAYEKKDKNLIIKIQVSILKDFRTTAIAVRRVATNKGSNTPGVDGKVLKTAKDRTELAKAVHKIMLNPSTYKPDAVKRVWVSKDNDGRRPLGIPTTIDRAVQAVYLEVVDPIVEINSCENSYGFRKFRNAKDAVLSLRGKLIHPKASEWVLSADISKCFDKISHEFLLRHVPLHRKVDRNIIMKMLKAKVIDQRDVFESENGTPQGGILSPVLANIALNGLEKTIKEKAAEVVKSVLGRRGNPKVHVVRYADDFIILAPSKKMLLVLMPAIENFLSKRGLQISKDKSSLFNIWENEIQFLGFSFKKKAFNYRTRVEIVWEKRKTKSKSRIEILPLKEKQKLFKKKVKDIVKSHTDISTLIITLSQYLRGWANYFNATSTSAEHVRKCHRYVLKLCCQKVGKIYPKLALKERKSRFFPKHKFYQNGRYVTRAWVFSSSTKLERPSNNFAKVRLYNLDSVMAPGKAIIKTGMNAYLSKDKLQLNKNVTLVASSSVEKIAARQGFICPGCGQNLGNGEQIEIHHSPNLKDWQLSQSQKGNKKNVKLFALHRLCHRKIHNKSK